MNRLKETPTLKELSLKPQIRHKVQQNTCFSWWNPLLREDEKFKKTEKQQQILVLV